MTNIEKINSLKKQDINKFKPVPKSVSDLARRLGFKAKLNHKAFKALSDISERYGLKFNYSNKKEWENEAWMIKFKTSVKRNETISGVLRDLELDCYNGGNYRKVNMIIKKYGIDVTHMKGQSHLKGKSFTRKGIKPLNELLVENSDYTNSHSLRKKLVKEKVLKYECSICGLTNWLGEDLSLQLDHINGNPTDNRIKNLRILCPNCHTQTKTWGAKKRK